MMDHFDGPKVIIDAIIDDMCDRRGFSNLWDEIDEDIQQVIRRDWQEIVRKKLLLHDQELQEIRKKYGMI